MLILASSSRYRRELLARAGIEVEVLAPDIDERAFDHLLEHGPCELTIAIATAKARAVARDGSGIWVLAADQVAVAEDDDGTPHLLTKPGTPERAVEQLTAMSGRTHRLVNGVVVWHAGEVHSACDVHTVTMRAFTRDEAQAYVDRFAPIDCVGAYRIEDDADLIASVEGSGDDGVIGLPIAVVRRLLADAGHPSPTDATAR